MTPGKLNGNTVEDALRGAEKVRAQAQELETLRAQLHLALNDVEALRKPLEYRTLQVRELRKVIQDQRNELRDVFRALTDKNDLLWELDQSRWFRLGQWLGFYR